MIRVTRLNGAELVLNADLIESLESTPDTIIALINGKKLVVTETVDDVIDKIVEYRQLIFKMVQVTRTSEI